MITAFFMVDEDNEVVLVNSREKFDLDLLIVEEIACMCYLIHATSLPPDCMSNMIRISEDMDMYNRMLSEFFHQNI